MVIFLLVLFLYCVSLMFYSLHPLALGLSLLFVTMFVGIAISLFLSPYVGFMVVIIGVGGVLVAISFALALVSYWDKVVDGVFMSGFKENMKNMFLVIFLFLVFGSTKLYQNLLDMNFIFFTEQWGVGVLFVGLVLFLSVVVVVYMVKNSCGALVDFKVK
uniref:NADH dehydrogenase subunit 6 n=1 Tax=Musculium lacustre TaxID=98299 RepID=UPI0022374449|nr:NADH dehydrogenase subunit 6 [Musculium lacustre]UYR45709.1 NADH dehydrogenase subunit 6 [Musculium lacustre]UYR45722.1 NADH dehydrogenase subunit 6 [Musculium lacustre]